MHYLKHAGRSTLKSLGHTRGTLTCAVLSAIGFVGLIWLFLGWPEAVSEFALVALSFMAFAGMVFLPLFLWHLWLAPTRILEEKLETKLKKIEMGHGGSQSEASKEAVRLHQQGLKARDEIERLRRCITVRENPQRAGEFADYDFNHDYAALMEKYREWFPRGLSEEQLYEWSGRIIATLKAQGYTEAKERIKEAAVKGDWN